MRILIANKFWYRRGGDCVYALNLEKYYSGEVIRKKKINWLLILQGWAMLWVVIGHAPLVAPHTELSPFWSDFLYDTAYSFHMPLFIFISGFLFYLTRVSSEKWNYLPMILEKLKRFGIPFLVFTVIGIFIKNFFGSSMERPTEISLGEFANAILYPNEGPMREFWFLATIMWYFVLFPLWRRVMKSPILISVFSLIAIVLHYIHPTTEFLAIDAVCIYLIYFFLGLCAGEFYKERGIKVENTSLTTIFIIIAVSLPAYAASRYFKIEMLEAFMGIIFSAGLAVLLDRIMPMLFHTFRNYTYQIFLMGIFVQVLVKILYSRLGLPYLPIYILSVAAGIYVPVLVSKLISWQPFEFLKLCIGIN